MNARRDSINKRAKGALITTGNQDCHAESSMIRFWKVPDSTSQYEPMMIPMTTAVRAKYEALCQARKNKAIQRNVTATISDASERTSVWLSRSQVTRVRALAEMNAAAAALVV